MAVLNPFAASFGVVPPELAGRLHILNEFDLGLEGSAGNSNRVMLLVGERGMGKTVLLETAEQRARSLGWVAVTASASPASGFLERLTSAVQERLGEQSGWWQRVTGMNAFGFGVTLSEVPSMDKRLELALASLSERLAKKGAGVIITVDELQTADADETRAVGNVLQIVANRRRLPIVFVGAGLPSSSWSSPPTGIRTWCNW